MLWQRARARAFRSRLTMEIHGRLSDTQTRQSISFTKPKTIAFCGQYHQQKCCSLQMLKIGLKYLEQKEFKISGVLLRITLEICISLQIGASMYWISIPFQLFQSSHRLS